MFIFWLWLSSCYLRQSLSVIYAHTWPCCIMAVLFLSIVLKTCSSYGWLWSFIHLWKNFSFFPDDIWCVFEGNIFNIKASPGKKKIRVFWHFFYLNSYRRKINLVRWKNLYLFKLFWRNIKDGFTTFVITFYLGKLFIIQQSMFLLRLLHGEDRFPWESHIKLRELSHV